MTKRATKDVSVKSNEASVDSTPDAALAGKVIATLVDDGLVSEADGERIRADIAAGKMDTGKWKLVLENQLERKARTDERK